MKTLVTLLAISLFLPFICADDDPAFLEYLDDVLRQTRGVAIVSEFYDTFADDFDYHLSMLDSYCAAGYQDVVDEISDDSTVRNDLKDQAKSMWQQKYGAALDEDSTNNWSFVIDLETKKVIAAYHAQDMSKTADENGVYKIETGAGSDLFHTQNVYPGNEVSFSYTNEDGETVTDTFFVGAAYNSSPIIIDLDVTGTPDTNRKVWVPHAPKFFHERVAIFDITGDDIKEFCEWLGPNDGLLVLPEPDGTVKNANNLFGTAGGYTDGYEKMAIVLDLDRNGWVEKDELNGLFLWRDLNTNARVDKGEMKTVQSYGIEKISVRHKNFQSVCYMKGKKVKIWDWWPACYNIMRKK